MVLYSQHIPDFDLASSPFERGLAKGCMTLAEAVRGGDNLGVHSFVRPLRPEEVQSVINLAGEIKAKADDVVILGAGAASLCGRLLVEAVNIATDKLVPRLLFFDNIDPAAMTEHAAALNYKRTVFIAISRSGETIETLAQWDYFSAQAEVVLGVDIRDYFYALVADRNSTLARRAQVQGASVTVFDPAISGRFSPLTIVGLLPAALCGIDIQGIIDGSKSVFQPLDHQSAWDGAWLSAWPPALAAGWVGHHYQHKAAVYGIMPYVDRLTFLACWICQLYGESLGKDGQGMTPVRLVGSSDQHSQFQLWLDGPKDKIMTLVAERPIDHRYYSEGGLFRSILDRQYQVSAEALCQAGQAVRRIEYDTLNAETIGALVAHCMAETYLVSQLLGVNPFDEPAIRQGKETVARDFPKLYQV